MIVTLAMAAWGAPVLGEVAGPEAQLASCAAGADGEVDGWTLAAPTPSDRVALVVGVPCHRNPGLPSLGYSSRDAIRVGAELEAGGFSVVHRTTVVDAADLRAAVDEAAALLEPEGTLVVYFSGHGVLREDGGELSRWLVMSDTDLGRITETAVPVSRVEGWMAETPAASRVLVQDTCFASGGKGLGLPEHTKGIAPLEVSHLAAGDVRLWASRFFEQAIEDPERRASIYTDQLLEALHEPSADLDGDGCVGLLEAHERARTRVAEERSGFQVPVSSTSAARDLVLGCRPGTPTRALLLGTPDDWELTLTPRRGEALHDPLAVAPGRYRLGVEADGHRLHHEVLSLEAGDRVELEDLLRRGHRARVQLQLAGTGRVTDELSRSGLGGAVDLVAPGVRWRFVVGAGGSEGLPAGDPPLSTREVVGRAGLWWTPPSVWNVAVGPIVEGGGVWRTLTTPARTDPGAIGGLLLHAQAGTSLGLLFAEAGGSFVPLAREDLALEVAPTLRVGLGVRL
ncbi:MAG: caspase family protein [Alphaproteobacteria bacterium]|nr:caspase family protein [Alphaproteobacteria bacterium]MCB9695563.1 caspase family protein [Alphaproteobacteria bacterium]